MLNIHEASKSFGSIPIFKNLTLKIEKNSIVGLAGHSGGGKSTLLRCIQGLETLESGEIVCEGRTGFMFQDFQLFPHMTVLENLIYAPSRVLKQTDSKSLALSLLEQLSLSNKANDFPSTLSGGQKQRVALARSLMMKPDLLLCDEPTSGLDVETIKEVVQLLKSIHDRGVTLLIASHDLDFLSQVAERLIVLKKGSIVEDQIF